MNKKGLSDIITTVLIILLALAAVILIWAFIRNSLMESGGQISSEVFTTQMSIPSQSVMYNYTGNVSLIVKREAGAGKLVAFVVTLKDINGKVVPFRYNNSLPELGTFRTPQINYSFYGLSNLSEISVIPIIGTDEGRELQGKHEVVYSVSGNTGSSGTVITPPSTYSLGVIISPAASGTVISNPAGINCGGTCSASYPLETNVSLTATVAPGYIFNGWSGACSGIGTCNVTMNSTKTVTFNATPFSIPINGLVAYYRFDEVSGSIAIDSSGTNNGTFVNSPVRVSGKVGSALSFNGINQYVVGDSSQFPTTDRTIALWFYFNGTTGPSSPGYASGIPFSYGGNSCGQSLFIAMANNSIGADVHCAAAGVSTSSINLANNWHFLVVTSSSNSRSIYLDGNLSGNVNSPFTTTYVSGKKFAIGVTVSSSGTAPYIDGNVGYFKGLVDELRVFNRSMNSTEISNIYHIGYNQP